MACDRCHLDCARPQRARLGILAADGATRTVVLSAEHNRWQVLVQIASTVTAGDVQVVMTAKDPEAVASWVAAKVGTIAYDASGGEAHGSMAPVGPRRLHAELSGYVGTGDVTVVLETWLEG